MVKNGLIFVLTILICACGKSGGEVSSQAQVVSSVSSSTSSISPINVEFVYPTQKSHLGGAASTKLILKINEEEGSAPISRVSVGGQFLTKDGDFWISTSNLLLSSTTNEEFPVEIEIDGKLITTNKLVLNNLGGQTVTEAGITPIYSVTGLTIDSESGALYFSNAFDQKLYKYNPKTSGSEVIYSSDQANIGINTVYWPIIIDSTLKTIYLLKDTFGFDLVSSSDKYTVQLVVVDNSVSPPLISSYEDKSSEPLIDKYGEIYPSESVIKSVRGIALDLSAKMKSSSTIDLVRLPSLYSLDYLSDGAIQRWFIGGDTENLGRSYSMFVVASGTDSTIGLNKTPLAMTGKPDNTGFLVMREGAADSLGGNNSGWFALIEVISNSQGGLTSKKLTHFTDLSKPTAIVYDKTGTGIYIADNNRIWHLDLLTFAKVLVSSSNKLPNLLGSGPKLGSNITAMALHPTLNYLYLAADTNGVIMVDLDTGNRITIIK